MSNHFGAFGYTLSLENRQVVHTCYRYNGYDVLPAMIPHMAVK
jgi:hypothetical protein